MSAKGPRVRVLLAEDSAVTREYLSWLVETDSELELVGAARDGAEAVDSAERLRPDVVLMDIHMPSLDGYEATRHIMERVPTPIVLVSASVSGDEAARTFEAIQAGALTVVTKPAGVDDVVAARELMRTVKVMAEVKVVRRWPVRTARPATAPEAPRTRRVGIVALGASTGGPAVLETILAPLPADLGAPILVVQHITAGFLQGFVDWLRTRVRLKVEVARSGVMAARGTVYAAPDGLQLGVDNTGRLRLTAPSAEDEFHPSVDHLFTSVAASYGPAALCALLTGMGRDGVAGLTLGQAAGVVTVAQDEESCVVFGMPGEAIRAGAAQQVLPPAEIATLIEVLTRTSARQRG